MTRATLTQQLFIRIIPTVLITVGVIGFLAFRSASAEIDSVYDAQLMNSASELWMLVQDEIREGNAEGARKILFDDDVINFRQQFSDNENSDDYAESRMLRIWQDGKLIMYSDTAFPAAVPPARKGFSDIVYQGKKWRLFCLVLDDGRIHIETGERLQLRHNFVHDIIEDLFLPLSLLLPVIGLLIWYGIGSGLASIRSLIKEIRQRSSDDLSPLAVTGLPQDFVPLAFSINQLMDRLRASFMKERRFADDAAHQLRTPLAGIKLQLQLLSKLRGDAPEAETITAGLLKGVDRASKLVSQLLSAARISHSTLQITPVALHGLCAGVAAEMGVFIADKSLNVSLSGDEKLIVETDEALCRVVLENLLENAVKYTPAGGNIAIDVGRANGAACIRITDSGPGIPSQERAHVFERFYRVNATRGEGAGLGLSIVAEILRRLSGDIRMATPESGQGLEVLVTLPETLGESGGINI